MPPTASQCAQDTLHARPTKRPAYTRRDGGETNRDTERERRAENELRMVLEFDAALTRWLRGRGITEAGGAVFIADQTSEASGPRFTHRRQPEASPVSMLPEPEHRQPPPAELEPEELLPALLHAAALHAHRMAATPSQPTDCGTVAPSMSDAAGGQAGGLPPTVGTLPSKSNDHRGASPGQHPCLENLSSFPFPLDHPSSP